MKKVKVIIKECRWNEVEYICEVDENEDMQYGIGEIESLGDMSNGGGDAMGCYCKDISKKIIDGTDDCEFEIVEWKIIKENK